ncbi:uncharacterized protein LOC131631645 [Vicia villosa]|uniref:uncharacterized protein LOC131631645 n=1 Tax=Vicia villosa TaxID=3911 RepID=UPI00273AAC7A|nr:uncharacterized protein LOC131631645 [Vicia villosa]
MWGDNQVEWSHLDANGASGGILTMWKKDLFNLNFSFRGEGFLGLCMEKEGKLIYFVNVYASCDISTRKRCWDRLCEFKNNNIKGSWCIGGDFNSITSLEERIGTSSRSYRREIIFFKEFIEDMELVDLPTIGDWKVECQYIGERDVSDHAPIWLKDNRKDWGPKPFKFNNMWFKHEDFDIFVEEWNKIVVKGRGNVPEDVVVKRIKVAEEFWDNINKREGVEEIKEFTFMHYESFFKEECLLRPELRGTNFNTLSSEDSSGLEKPFEEDEVKGAIWSCDGSKSPGPDGFSLEFYKRYWSLIKEDVMKCCNDFYHKGTLVKFITSSFLDLIPKKKNP